MPIVLQLPHRKNYGVPENPTINCLINQLKMVILLLFLMFFYVEAQRSSSQDGLPITTDEANNFQPSLAIVICILFLMFTVTFILLVYSKFCHRAATPVQIRSNQQNLQGLISSGSRSSGIDKTVIESLPFFKFSSLRGSREGLECAVCLSKFEDIEILRLLPKCKHAFHINCIDQWLEKHSSCPLCRHKVNPDDLRSLTFSNSLRFLRNPSESHGEDSNLELFVQREESSRFSVGGSFRILGEGKKEEELPIQENSDLNENQKILHKFNHKIIVSDVVLKNRWSSVSSSDLMFLKSEMIGTMSSCRFSSLDLIGKSAAKRVVEDGDQIMKIKEEMERKRMFESKVSKMNQIDSLLSAGGPSPNSSKSKGNSSNTSRIVNPSEKRSMSEIIAHPRFTELSMKNYVRDSSFRNETVKEERVKRVWLPIARRTVQWLANRETRSQQKSQDKEQSLNV
ncbi:hypothetical protein NMG60_11021896 [Bertholletia excelsa]